MHLQNFSHSGDVSLHVINHNA